MRVPRIEFRYSWAYDQKCKTLAKFLWPRCIYHPEEKIKKHIAEIEPLWRKDEKKIFTELSRITGLSWRKHPSTSRG